MIKIGGKADHGFDEPLGLLSDCHRRIEWFLGILLKVSRTEQGQTLSGEARQAVEQALAYFATAGPRHTADEEESLFPVLRSAGTEEAARVMSIVEGLEADHRRAEEGHAAVDRLARRWIDAGRLDDREAADLIGALESLQRAYEGHIRVEDSDVFPAAARILSSEQLEKVGREMAARRGVKPASGRQS